MKEYLPAASGPNAVDGSATPATSVTVPAPADAPVQSSAVVYHVNVTLPVGVPAPVPLTVALSCTVEPNGTDVTAVLWFDPLWISVTVDVFALPTDRGSHTASDSL